MRGPLDLEHAELLVRERYYFARAIRRRSDRAALALVNAEGERRGQDRFPGWEEVVVGPSLVEVREQIVTVTAM